MITATTYDRCYSYMGLSESQGDTKPTEGVGNGSTYFEMNTGKVFVFSVTANADGTYTGTWIEI